MSGSLMLSCYPAAEVAPVCPARPSPCQCAAQQAPGDLRGQVSHPSPGLEAGHAGGGPCPWLVTSLCLGANCSENMH